MAKRKQYSGSNCYSVCVNVTEQLYHNLAAKADEYELTRSALIRALLENIDDAKLYSKLLGPSGREP